MSRLVFLLAAVFLLAPARAAASAASVPAWPPPMTMTSKGVMKRMGAGILPTPAGIGIQARRGSRAPPLVHLS